MVNGFVSCTGRIIFGYQTNQTDPMRPVNKSLTALLSIPGVIIAPSAVRFLISSTDNIPAFTKLG